MIGPMRAPKSPNTSDLNNRARLLRAATDAFAEHGYEGASLRAIAHNAGVSFQLITHYFGTKTELWLATVDYLHERYFETGKGLGFNTAGNIRAQFHNHLRLLLTDILQRPQLRKIWVQEYLAGSDRFANVIKPKIKEFNDTVSLPYYKEVVRLGLVRKYAPEDISQLFAGIVLVNVVHSHYLELVTGHPAGSAKSIDTQIDLLFRVLTEEPNEQSAPYPLDNPVRADEAVIYAWDRTRNTETADELRLKQLEEENNQLRQLLANVRLENSVLVDMLERSTKLAGEKASRSGSGSE